MPAPCQPRVDGRPPCDHRVSRLHRADVQRLGSASRKVFRLFPEPISPTLHQACLACKDDPPPAAD
jgi:hypothetical protein